MIEDIFRFAILTNNTDINVTPLINYAYELKSNTKGETKSNISAWQSGDLDNDLHILKELKGVVNYLSNEFYQYMNLKKSHKVEFDNCWFNINPKGGSNKPHSHPGSIFSGVLYLKASENSGNINFINPCKQHDYHFDDMVEQHNIYTGGEYWHKPEVGKLIIFPSSLEHYVEGNCSDDDRISISFNTKAVSL